MIRLAYSSHKACFICGSTQNLHLVKKASIRLILKKYKIFVKYGTQCCTNHLNQEGLVERDFHIIRTRDMPKKITLDSKLLSDLIFREDVFDQFKNIKYLSNEHCYNITGWTKEQLLEFTNYLNSLNENNFRSKYELVAIYMDDEGN